MARAAHRPYGERWVDWRRGDARPPAYRFTDEEEDRLSGAVYIGARHDLPSLGRWASVDPALREPGFLLEGGGQSSGYGYATANPVTLVDDDGRGPEVAMTVRILQILKARYEMDARARHAAAVAKLRRRMRRTGGPKAQASGEIAAEVAKRTEAGRAAIEDHGKVATFVAEEVAGGGTTAAAVKRLGEVVRRMAAARAARAVAQGPASGASRAATIPAPREGQQVYRLYGGQAGPHGASWTPTRPTGDFRARAGLPSGGASGATNEVRFVIEGTLENPSAVVKVRPALPLDGNPGGIQEYIIPNAIESGAVRVDRVSGVNPEF